MAAGARAAGSRPSPTPGRPPSRAPTPRSSAERRTRLWIGNPTMSVFAGSRLGRLAINTRVTTAATPTATMNPEDPLQPGAGGGPTLAHERRGLVELFSRDLHDEVSSSAPAATSRQPGVLGPRGRSRRRLPGQLGAPVPAGAGFAGGSLTDEPPRPGFAGSAAPGAREHWATPVRDPARPGLTGGPAVRSPSGNRNRTVGAGQRS